MKRIFPAAIILLAGGILLYDISLCEGEGSFIYDSKGKRDPFVPFFAEEVKTYESLENIQSAEDLILEGIIWDPKEGSIAVINGVILKEGDTVSNIYISNISPTEVTLTVNNIEHKLTLEEKEEGLQ